MNRKATGGGINRREFVTLAAGGLALGALPTIPNAHAVEAALKSRIKAIAFDAFPIFDPSPVFDLTKKLFAGVGAELSNEWRIRQFEYSWLRVAARRYVDFWRVTQDALEYAADKLHLSLARNQRHQLMNAYLRLKTWPDVGPALATLRASGFRLAFLSNFTSEMLESNIESAGLSVSFEHVLSTDRAKTYKPDPRAYQLATEAFKLERQEILFVASAGWDAAGAKLFGFPTFWLNRQNLPEEKLDAAPDGLGDSLAQLVRFMS